MTDLSWLITGGVLGVCAALLGARPVIGRAVRRALEAERRARDAERLAEIGSMTSGLAHEIKNPLSTIGLNAQLLGESVDELDIPAADRDPLTRRVDALTREAERLRDILEDFLRFAGEFKLSPRECDITEAVREFADFFEPQALQQGGGLVIDAPPGLRAWADADALKQALLNLALNALQASESDGGAGRVTIRVEPAEHEPLGSAVVVSVTDEGPGVPAERREEIFRPYHTTKRSGAGLGLAITKRLVEEMGGRIGVTDAEPRGARFEIALPVAPPDPLPA